jgi:hypothetical protein
MGPQTWRVRIERVRGCFLVRADAGPTKRACKLSVVNTPYNPPSHSSYTVAQVQRVFGSAGIVMERLPIPRRAFGFIALRPANVTKDGVFILVFTSTRNAQAWEALVASRRAPFPVRTFRRRNVVVREETLSSAQSARLATALKALSALSAIVGSAANLSAEQVKYRPPFVPWWPLATAVLLVTAFAIALGAGRTIDAVIVGVLLVPTLALLGLWLLARKRG